VKEPPHKTLLDRNAAAKAIAEGYGPQLEMLTDMVNYASNLIPRVYSSGERKLRDVIVCFVLLKQFASMLDAVEMLSRAGVGWLFAGAMMAFSLRLDRRRFRRALDALLIQLSAPEAGDSIHAGR
jgi:hypothetical protein